MTTQAYRQLILEGMGGLPSDMLAEIADFVYFVRKRAMEPQAFRTDMQDALARAELAELSRDQEAHLEEEFEGYDRRYPPE